MMSVFNAMMRRATGQPGKAHLDWENRFRDEPLPRLRPDVYRFYANRSLR